MLICGKGRLRTFTMITAVLVQPLADPVTVYCWLARGETTTLLPVTEFSHVDGLQVWLVEEPFAKRVAGFPRQTKVVSIEMDVVGMAYTINVLVADALLQPRSLAKTDTVLLMDEFNTAVLPMLVRPGTLAHV